MTAMLLAHGAVPCRGGATIDRWIAAFIASPGELAMRRLAEKHHQWACRRPVQR